MTVPIPPITDSNIGTIKTPGAVGGYAMGDNGAHQQKAVVTFTISVDESAGVGTNTGAIIDHLASIHDDVQGVTVEAGRPRNY